MDVDLLPIKMSSSPPEPLHLNQKLRWDHQVRSNLLSPCLPSYKEPISSHPLFHLTNNMKII